MKTFSFTPIGTGAALPARGRHPAAHVVNVDNRLYLVDCGEGTQLRLRQLGVKMHRIDHVFISHLHGDHYLGLVGFISSLHLNGRKAPLNVYGPPMLKEIIDLQLRASGTFLRFSLFVHPIEPENGTIIHQDEGVTVTTLAMKHRVPCTGFMFSEAPRKRKLRKDQVARIPHYHRMAVQQGEDLVLEDGKTVPNAELTYPPPPQRRMAYCSDTAPQPALVPFIQGVDLLYHEATFTQEYEKRAKETQHSTAAQAAAIAAQAGVGKLLLGHFSSRYKHLDDLLAEAVAIWPATELAEEGKVYTINDPIVEKP